MPRNSLKATPSALNAIYVVVWHCLFSMWSSGHSPAGFGSMISRFFFFFLLQAFKVQTARSRTQRSETERNETKSNETKRNSSLDGPNETNLNETERSETKRNDTFVWQISFKTHSWMLFEHDMDLFPHVSSEAFFRFPLPRFTWSYIIWWLCCTAPKYEPILFFVTPFG